MKDLILEQIYKTACIVEDAISLGAPLELNNKNLLDARKKAIAFNKETLLHLFIKQQFVNYYSHYFCEMTESLYDEVLELLFLEDQFLAYNVPIDFLNIKYDSNGNPTTKQYQIVKWFKRNESKFVTLSEKICNEIFFIVFSNRKLLYQFNENLTTDFDLFKFKRANLTRKGTLKRKAIPKWVQYAVFHRDKGRCSFCSTDLSKIINIESTNNYDHIIPLDMFGVNDPTNIQLLCKTCNMTKLNRNKDFGKIYQEWF